MERISREQAFMEIARVFARRATCGRLQVGCIITNNNRIISSGYNGPLPHEVDCEEVCHIVAPCIRAVHAEANAIYAAARAGIPLLGSTIYCTHSPCMKCCEAIVASGIICVVYAEEFRDEAPLQRLASAGIEVIKL